jgi:uncharacterized RDD family membrane protein YckC
MDANPLRYSGAWSRLGALLLDGVIILPLLVLVFGGNRHYRLFPLYYFFPHDMFALFYSVYIVRRFGGTPGKLIVGLRIRKLDGAPVGYREAFFRFLPWWLSALPGSIAMIAVCSHMSDTDFYSLNHVLSVSERTRRLIELDPSWVRPLRTVQNLWILADVIVFFCNRERRALHDFIAGTVVIHAPSEMPANAPSPT